MHRSIRHLQRKQSVFFLAGLLVACGEAAEPSGAGGSTTGAAATGSRGGGGSGDSGGGTGGVGGAGGGGSGGCFTDVTAKPGTVITDRGAVTGALVGATYSYKNIPFAAPPVGDLRWKQPQPVACWSGERDATAWGNLCGQLDGNGLPIGSEDCLSLNVWTPGATPAKPLPVLVWIHGGGYTQGGAPAQSGKFRTYDGQHLSKEGNVVIVTINYRLGPLGFLAHPALSESASSPSSGNLGALDQIAALAWVKRNAAAFGGDAARVTIMGESVGGSSVCALVASPLAKGLFSGAIMQSGLCDAIPLATAEGFGAKVFAAAKCDTAPDPAACMRALSAQAVLTALPDPADIAGQLPQYGGVVDMKTLLGSPVAVIKSGAHNHVPFIVGNTSDETSRAVPASILTNADYVMAVKTRFGAMTSAILEHYPSSSYASPRAAYVAVTSDSRFICNSRRSLRALLAGQAEPAYRFVLTHALENGGPTIKVLGAWHAVDVLYLFNELNILAYMQSPGEAAICSTFGGDWSRFAATGDPSAAGGLQWSTYAMSDPYLQLDTAITMKSGYRTAKCDFWDSVLP